MISRIGKYTIEADLGCGGFGRVYKAWDPDVRQSVAIKVMLAEGDADLLKRFQQEVVTTASLHHQNIVTIYASGEEEGTPYLVMELLEGQTLAEIIKQRTPLSVMDRVRIMTQVAEGLAYAHSRGVVHRDVKPANIMMLPDGSVKIMDFGIAVASNRRTAGLTMEGFVLGTVSYMSPEQFGPDGKANEQTDIFAYGVVYYELMAGRHPFEAFLRDLNALRVAVLTHDPPAVSELVQESPEAVDLLIHRCLAKEREFRYQTFEELRLDGASVLVDLQHDQASSILREVTPLVARGDLQQARAKVREAQRLEPGNREARQLLETIDQKLQEGLNRDRIASRLTEAEKYLAERRFAEAVQSLETAARLDPGSATVQTRLQEAKVKLDGAVQANRLLEEARVMLQRGDATSALARLESAIQIDPGHTEARRLHPKIAEQLKRRQREQIREAAIRSASEHLSGKRYDAALATLDQLEGQDPEATGIAELRRDIEGKRDEDERRARSQRFHLAVSATRETLEAGDLDRAGEMLERLDTNFASEPGLRDVTASLRSRLRGLQRDRKIARWRQRAQNLLDRNSFREASDLIAEALREFPADAGLLEQKTAADALYQAERREAEIAAYVEKVRGHLRRGDAGRAAAELAAARARHPGEGQWPALQAEIDELQARMAREAQIAAYIEKVRGHLRRGDAGRALADLAAARTRHPGEGQWPVLQAEIDGLQAEISAAEAQRLEDRVRQLEAARAAEIAAYTERVRGHLRRGDVARAGAELAAARARHPGEGQWPALQAEIDGLQAEISAAEAQRLEDRARQLEAARAAEVAAYIEKVRGQLRRGDVARAGAELAAARARHPGEGQWPALQAEIDGLLAEAAREAEVAAYIEKVRGQLRRGDVARAGAELAAARARHPGADQWPGLQAEIDGLQAEIFAAEAQRLEDRARQLAAARAAEVAAYIEKVRGHLRRGDAGRAGAELAAARARHPGEGQWPALQAEIDGLLAEAAREAEVAAYIEKVRGHLRRGGAGRAAAELAAERARHPGEDQWPALQAEIDATAAAEHTQKPTRSPAKKPFSWKLAAAVAGAAIVIPSAILGPRWLHKPEVKPATVAIEIRTDPPGAAVRLGDRSCQSPNCRLDVAPGSYPVEVKLKDYLEKRQVVVVDPSTHVVELTLEPIPIPVPVPQPGKTETGQIAAETGTLLVQAGVPDALVYVDGVARSRTGRSGSLSLSLEAKAHEVRVERNGYEATPARKVTVPAGSQQTVAFTLALRAAKLELGGAPAGAEVRSGNQSLGVTDGSAVFHFPASVKPGSQPLQVTLGSASRTIQQRFDPGQTVHLEWKDIAPAAPAPTAETLERQQWERVRTSSDAEQLRTFLRSYPNGAHANETGSRLADLQWSAVDQTNSEAVRKFLKDNPDSAHRADARRIVDQLAERSRLEQARLDAAKKQELAKQEAVARQDQQRRQVLAAAKQLDTALQGKRAREVKAIWPGASPLLLEAVGKAGVKMSLTIREEDIRFSEEAERATVQGRLLSTVNGNTTAQKATLTLRNSGGTWTVEGAKFEQER